LSQLHKAVHSVSCTIIWNFHQQVTIYDERHETATIIAVKFKSKSRPIVWIICEATMTILEGVSGLEVSIQSNGQDLSEYNDDSDWSQRKFIYVPVEKRISKYVECVTDAEFRIHIVLTNRYPYLNGHSLTFRASVDGHGIAQATCTPEYFNAYRSYRTHISARLDRISPTQLSSRVLKFSSIKKGQFIQTPVYPSFH